MVLGHQQAQRWFIYFLSQKFKEWMTGCINSSPPDATYMWSGSVLLQVMGWSPVKRIVITSTNADLLSIGTLGTNVGGIWIKIQIFPFMKIRVKMASTKWYPFSPGGYELIPAVCVLSVFLQIIWYNMVLEQHQTLRWFYQWKLNELRVSSISDKLIKSPSDYMWISI